MKAEVTIQLDSRREKRLVEDKVIPHRTLCYEPEDPEWRAISAWAGGTQMTQEKLGLIKIALNTLMDRCEEQGTEKYWESSIPGEGNSALIRNHGEMRKTLAESRQQAFRNLAEVYDELLIPALKMARPW